jgi:hypothetical protein
MNMRIALTILDPNGAPVQLDFCGAQCETCMSRGCTGCQAPTFVPDGGVTATGTGRPTTTCKEVPFDWPMNGQVSGSVGP